jgi:hypothetical protein
MPGLITFTVEHANAQEFGPAGPLDTAIRVNLFPANSAPDSNAWLIAFIVERKRAGVVGMGGELEEHQVRR